MRFTIVDTKQAYRALLAAPNNATRNAIFQQQLIAPFEGVVRIFGGDGLTTFAQWGMAPSQFAGENQARMAASVEQLVAYNAWERSVQALERGKAAFAPFAEQIGLDHVTFGLFLADFSRVPLHRGYTGFGGLPGYIMTVYDQPDAYNMGQLEGCTVHELHHNVRFTLFPFNPMTTNVGEYIVAEGLAESFATELYGAQHLGFMVAEFDQEQVEETRQIMAGALERTGFDVVRGYIFGDPIADAMGLPRAGVPAFAGYAIGYQVVQAYLQRSGKSVAEATLLPAAELIAESRFFE